MKSFRLHLKLIFRSNKARKQFLYLLNLLLVILLFPFNVFIAHPTIAFIKSSTADASKARLV